MQQNTDDWMDQLEPARREPDDNIGAGEWSASSSEGEKSAHWPHGAKKDGEKVEKSAHWPHGAKKDG